MKLKGWKNILSFTYLQMLKTKSFKVGTIVVCILTALLCAAINIVPALFSINNGTNSGDVSGDGSDGEGAEPVYVNTLYVYNGSELELELLPVEDVEYLTLSDDGLSERIDAVTFGDKPEMLLCIYDGQGEDIYLTYYRPEDEEVLPEYTAESYAKLFTEAFTQALYLSIGVEEGDLPLAQAGIYSYIAVSGES